MSEDTVEINDFGFSMVSEDSVKQTEKNKADAIEAEHLLTQRKLKRIKDRIWPMLEGLKKDPDKEMIKWPNRFTVITKVMAEIEAIIAE
jgi:hypothetical protein